MDRMPGDRDDDRAERGGRAVSMHAVRDVCANNCVIDGHGWGIIETYLLFLTGVHSRQVRNTIEWIHTTAGQRLRLWP